MGDQLVAMDNKYNGLEGHGRRRAMDNKYNGLEGHGRRRNKKPFRMPVSGVYKIKGVGDVITGRIEQGFLKPNEVVGFAPSGIEGKAFSIEMHHKTHDQAGPGDNVGINVKGLPKDNLPKVGDVMYNAGD